MYSTVLYAMMFWEYEDDWDDGYDEQNDQDQGDLELGVIEDALRAFGLVL